jgi:hypothetical protein
MTRRERIIRTLKRPRKNVRCTDCGRPLCLGVPASGVVFNDKKAEGQPINIGHVYQIFTGAHSVLLYRTNSDWFIVQS